MEQEFTEFSKSDKSMKHELRGLNSKILSLKCVLLVLWQHPGVLHKKWLGGRFETFYCNDKYFCY